MTASWAEGPQGWQLSPDRQTLSTCRSWRPARPGQVEADGLADVSTYFRKRCEVVIRPHVKNPQGRLARLWSSDAEVYLEAERSRARSLLGDEGE